MLPIPRELERKLKIIHKILMDKGYTVATAESCSGGLLATLLTELSGSSSFFLGGVCSYSNHAKTAFLGIEPELFESKGAVSREVAEKMALSIRQKLDADFSLSLTGVAGPGGGSVAKPVGSVWFGFSSRTGVESKFFSIEGSREDVRLEAVSRALSYLHHSIEG